MWNDLRLALRTLGKNPSFVIISVVVLALGVGANTAIFSIVNAVFFMPQHVPAPDELAYIYEAFQADRIPTIVDPADYRYLRDHNEAFVDLTNHWGIAMPLIADGQTDNLRGECVAANYFDVLRVKPSIGRTFLPGEDDVATPHTAMVISNKLWARRFGSNPAIIGKQVRLNNDVYTIVGVAQEGFDGITDPWNQSQFWITSIRINDRYFALSGFPIGRLKPGTSLQQAQAMIKVQSEQIRRSRPFPNTIQLFAFGSQQVRLPFDPNGTFVPSRVAAALMAVVGMVMLIAAANIAGILMARVVTRRGEIAVRRALGAGNSRIVWQVLSETLLLSLFGGLAGLWLARLLLRVFHTYTPASYAMDIPLDVRVVLFAIGVCICAGVIAGIGPALQASRVNVANALSGSGVSAGRPSRARLRHWVVVPQIGLSLVLLLIAGLYVRSITQLESQTLGYNVDALTVNVRLSSQPGNNKIVPDQPSPAERSAERSRVFYRKLFDKLKSLPEGRDIAIASTLPLTADVNFERFSRTVAKDAYIDGNREGLGSLRAAVSPGYFETMGMRIVRGRSFNEDDVATAPRVAILSEALAKQLWPGQDPIDRFVAYVQNDPRKQPEWMQVVGIVNEVDPILHNVGESPYVYTALGQEWYASANFLIAKSRGDPNALVAKLSDAVTGSDPYAETTGVRTMKERVAEILYPRRMAAGILAVAGLIGLLLASVGIYGVVSYSVAQRTHEIGIRAALGAKRADIMSLVLKDGFKVALISSIVGLVLTHEAVQLATRYFAAVPALDVVTSVSVAAILAAVVLLACFIPARRASRTDPMQILRSF